MILLASAGPVTAEIDRALQAEIDQLFETHNTSSFSESVVSREEAERFMAEQQERDRQVLRRLDEIVEEHGWPGASLVGETTSEKAFLIVQHSDHSTWLRYLPLIKEAVEDGQQDPQSFAMLQDRILVSEGKKQIYGTQHRADPRTGELIPFPIMDEEHVDERRAELGLIPLAEYLGAASRYARAQRGDQSRGMRCERTADAPDPELSSRAQLPVGTVVCRRVEPEGKSGTDEVYRDSQLRP